MSPQPTVITHTRTSLKNYHQYINTQPSLHHQSPDTQPNTSLCYSEMDKDLPGTLSDNKDPIQLLLLPRRGAPATRPAHWLAPYPSTAPLQPSTTGKTTNTGGRTQRPNRTPQEIQAAEATQALKRQAKSDKAAAKLAKTRVKAAQKDARDMIKAKEKEAATIRLKWSLEPSLELLRYVKVVKEAHDLMEQQQPGFVKFAKFMESYDPRTEYFPLLAQINNETRLRQYRVLVGIYRVRRCYPIVV
jgi:hypothetical protein